MSSDGAGAPRSTANGEGLAGAASGAVLRGAARALQALSLDGAAGPDTRACLARADTIVVLGCRVSASGRLTAAAAGRAEAAADAYRAGVAPRIVASGGRRWGATVEALALQRALIARGVPREAILAELWSLTTYENAVFSAAMLRKLGARSAVIVSCAWHLPRALQSFRTAGLEVSAWPRPGRAGLYDRCAEALRGAYDDLAIRSTAVLRGSADTFFEDAGR